MIKIKFIAFTASSIIGIILSCCTSRPACEASINGSHAIENIMTRTSVRKFDPRHAITADTVEILLRAAMAAPTAMNRQPWAFIVVDDRAVLDDLLSASPYSRLETAPMAIIHCGDMSLALEGTTRDFWTQDVAAATENILLAANALGLGSVWTGVYPDTVRVEGVRRVLGLPDSIIPLSIVPIGYPATKPEPKDKWAPSKVHHNGWKQAE